MTLSLEELELLKSLLEREAYRLVKGLNWTPAVGIYIKICEEIKERRSRLIEK